MAPYYERDGITLYVGDCRDIAAALPPESVHAVVTDPPAGIGFMSKEWDRDKGGRDQWVAWLASVLSECNRAMTPGAHAFVWALPRTSGWTHRAIEDAGLEVRDCCLHLFGSGFPKSHNLQGEWEGWGTALKPGAEFWYLARKPLRGTVAATVLAHGTGALNVDACRIDTNGETWGGNRDNAHTDYSGKVYGAFGEQYAKPNHPAGRWPANVLLDEDAAALLDQMSGTIKSRNSANGVKRNADESRIAYGSFSGGPQHAGYRGEDSGASRFFYVAKASRRERNAGLEGLPERAYGLHDDDGYRQPGERKANHTAPRPAANHHPTVKPLALMRWLVTLVTPPGGVVFDPFAGSGTTGVACAELGIPCVLAELSEEYAEIIVRRIDHALNERAQVAPLPLQPALEGVAD